LVSALTRGDLTNDYVSILTGTGPFTVFAPTNAAFEALLASNSDWNSLSDIPVDVLQTVLNYHVIAGANVLSSSLSNGQEVTAFSEEKFMININDMGVSIKDGTSVPANIVAVDVQGGNGVIHVIDKVILPPSIIPADPNIVEFASGIDDFSSLVAALAKADLVSALESEGPFTVFAPTNEAFAAFLEAKGFANLEAVPTETLTKILLNHVVSGAVTSDMLETGYVSTLAMESSTDNKLSLFIDLSEGVKLNGTAMVTTPDYEVTNGVIHVIDAVIDVPTVVTHALANSNFSILVAALTREDLTTDYVSVLTGAGPFTVFAPTNAAFEDLLASNNDWNSLSDIPVATLEAVLNYHVVNGANVLSSTLTDGQVVTALSTDTFTININGGSVTITDENQGVANIVAVDVQGGNGVIHVIDKVILPL
jgi:transforming growth factor-beta-induced protein